MVIADSPLVQWNCVTDNMLLYENNNQDIIGMMRAASGTIVVSAKLHNYHIESLLV